MRDLEIRGAGNLLGSEQSGHVAAVGFELYCRMLDEAVAAAQTGGEGAEDGLWEPVRLDVPVDAFVPSEYIPYEVAKIDVHRRVAATRDRADLAALGEELEDRFGPIPAPVDALLKLQDARIRIGRAGARTAELRGDRFVIAPVELDSSQAGALRAELDEVVYESLKRTLRVGMPEETEERLPAVLKAAEALERAKTTLAEAA
jgi:transcription-repair coupling factor (superfamily II helicase)